ncbi:MAG: hypothetical protein G8237_07960 [Magnetococcales bacterium]|nr:hypothetical protein [Magnetococcales bacterium]
MSQAMTIPPFVPALSGVFAAHQSKDGREYPIHLYHPHVFTLAINQQYPHFSNHYAVNLGAGDGKSCQDPVYPLYEMGYSGLAVDATESDALFNNLPNPKIKKILGQFITPINITDLLISNKCPQSPDMLKLDVDGYDGPILLEILKAGYQPKLLQVEVNPEIPPPIEFAVLYDPNYRPLDDNGFQGGFYGASLAYICNMTRRFGYHPIQIDFISPWTHDVTLVHHSCLSAVLPLLQNTHHLDSLREMYLAHPPGYSHFAEYGMDTNTWRHRTDYHELLREIWHACLVATLTKHKNQPTPFLLTVS